MTITRLAKVLCEYRMSRSLRRGRLLSPVTLGMAGPVNERPPFTRGCAIGIELTTAKMSWSSY